MIEIDLEHERRLTAVEDRAKSNTRRIDELEQSHEAISQLACSMKVMAEKQEQVADTVDKLDGKVTALEAKPGKRWEAVVEKVTLAIVAGLVGFVLAQLGVVG